MKTIFEIEGLHHTYGGPRPVDALRGVDLRIEQGEYVAIAGANGSGKSTLARHLNGLLLPTRGEVRALDLDTRQPAPSQLRAIRQAVQMVFQQPDAQLVAAIVEEDVAFGPENFGVPESELPGRVRQALETVGMWALRSRPPHQLSAGQKQRVAIAGALALHPRALILDEATAMLDPAGRSAVLDVLAHLHASGTTIVTITHEMDEAAQAERMIVLSEGRVVMDGAPREIFARGSELQALGLDVPPVTDLALRLGLPVCLSVEELIEAMGSAPRDLRARKPAPELGLPVEPILQVQGLRHTYMHGTPLASEALRGIDAEIRRGEIVGLVGHTGSGKSTLMQHFNGLLRPQAGRVIVEGRDLADPAADLRAVRRTVGLLFQQPEDQLFERFVGDDVAFGPRQMGLDKGEVRERVRAAMEAVGMGFEAFKDRLTRTLSGGEKRRAALAGVLALRPSVLVTDEPTAGLDPRGRAQVHGILREVNRAGVTVVIASHRMEDIAALCDRVIVLDGGQVVTVGTPREVFSQPALLAEHALAMPPLAQAAHALRQAGWPVPAGALTVDEIAQAVAFEEAACKTWN